MHLTRTIGADGREEILGFEPAVDVVKFFAVACEEDLAVARAVAYAYYVALHVVGGVRCAGEGLVVAAQTVGYVCEGLFVVSYTSQVSVYMPDIVLFMRLWDVKNSPGNLNNG